jgi:hypothetical protein
MGKRGWAIAAGLLFVMIGMGVFVLIQQYGPFEPVPGPPTISHPYSRD